ncbi:hypothetical protein OAK48_00115 [Deltaproteobacteria bacterium]|nr:hypothetical protein [Deltaproteobacteria bacterium]
MLNQQIIETHTNRQVRKIFVSFFLAILIFCTICLNPFSNLFAQKLTPELIACYQSAQARYECFLKQREGELERAKAIDALRRSILEAKEKIRFELINLEKKQRVKERKQMMKQVEISRSRNISHKGEKYSINFGYVFEASP